MLTNDESCQDIMDPQVNRFGVGYAQVPGSQFTNYWTSNFGIEKTLAAADQSCLGDAPSPTPTPSPAPSPGAPCVDLDTNCPTAYAKYCIWQAPEGEHIRETCPLTCGMCTPTPTPSPAPSPGAPCVDFDTNCPTDYAKYCDWQDAEGEHIRNTCPLTCRMCTP